VNELQVSMKQSIEHSSLVLNILKDAVHQMELKEHQRLHSLCHVEMQTDPPAGRTLATQTEFICPPVRVDYYCD
jgi:hypothetical protein